MSKPALTDRIEVPEAKWMTRSTMTTSNISQFTSSPKLNWITSQTHTGIYGVDKDASTLVSVSLEAYARSLPNLEPHEVYFLHMH